MSIFKTIDGVGTFIKSEAISVYPCAYRGFKTTGGKNIAFDPEARSNTERNITATYHAVAANKQSYIVDFVSTGASQVLKLVIGGYYFEITSTEDNLETAFNNKFLGIAQRDVVLMNGSDISRKTKVLESWDTGTASTKNVDVKIDSDYIFAALKIADTAAAVADGISFIPRRLVKTTTKDSSNKIITADTFEWATANSLLDNVLISGEGESSVRTNVTNALGAHNKTSGAYDVAFGSNNNIYGANNIAFGTGNAISELSLDGNMIDVIGVANKATAYAFVSGTDNTIGENELSTDGTEINAANADYSLTVGADNYTGGKYAVNIGRENRNTTAYGTTIGEGLKNEDNEYHNLVIGKYNDVSSTHNIFTVGDGTSDDDRHNLVDIQYSDTNDFIATVDSENFIFTTNFLNKDDATDVPGKLEVSNDHVYVEYGDKEHGIKKQRSLEFTNAGEFILNDENVKLTNEGISCKGIFDVDSSKLTSTGRNLTIGNATDGYSLAVTDIVANIFRDTNIGKDGEAKNLKVFGITDLVGNTTIAGNTTIGTATTNASLIINGTGTITDKLTTAKIDALGDVTIGKRATKDASGKTIPAVPKNLAVIGDTTIEGKLTANNTVDINADTTIIGNVTIGKDATDGSAAILKNLTVNGAITATGKITTASDIETTAGAVIGKKLTVNGGDITYSSEAGFSFAASNKAENVTANAFMLNVSAEDSNGEGIKNSKFIIDRVGKTGGYAEFGLTGAYLSADTNSSNNGFKIFATAGEAKEGKNESAKYYLNADGASKADYLILDGTSTTKNALTIGEIVATAGTAELAPSISGKGAAITSGGTLMLGGTNNIYISSASGIFRGTDTVYAKSAFKLDPSGTDADAKEVIKYNKDDKKIEIVNVDTITANGRIKTDGEVECKKVITTSDMRLKENIVDYTSSKSILDLPVKKFNYIGNDVTEIGCLAQDLEQIAPELVFTRQDGFLAITENKLVYLLINEVKKLKARVDELEKLN